jgi:GH24 family phage-related lysozyme (muramidase)
MAGFMRQPQIINDPNAAPAAMRADDVDLQAQEGDFIMGYPAMQQSGPRVRSLVEQAMLRAKDKGVKTKGYKKGDKVDILVHNKEMHIPQEIIPYIDGGYTTLKKLNQPSKYQSKGTVTNDIDEQSYYNLSNKELVDKKDISDKEHGINEIIDEMNPNIKSEIDSLMENQKYKSIVDAPVNGMSIFNDTIFRNTPMGKEFGSPSTQLWDAIDKKVKKMINGPKHHKSKKINKMIHKETMMNLKEAVENNMNEEFNENILIKDYFLDNAIGGTTTNHLLQKVNYMNTGKKIATKVEMNPKSIKFNYIEGTPELFQTDTKPHPYLHKGKNMLHYESDENAAQNDWLTRDINRLYNNTGNYNSVGGTGHNGNKHNIEFPAAYEEFFDYLDVVEGNQSSPYNDGNQMAIGRGHKLTPNEFKKWLNTNATDEEIDDLTRKDIMTAEKGAKDIYEDVVNHPEFRGLTPTKFNELDTNRKIMLMDFVYNLGATGARQKFPNFMNALIKDDYKGMKKEYKRYDSNKDELKERNYQFKKRFLDPQLDGFDINSIKWSS